MSETNLQILFQTTHCFQWLMFHSLIEFLPKPNQLCWNEWLLTQNILKLLKRSTKFKTEISYAHFLWYLIFQTEKTEYWVFESPRNQVARIPTARCIFFYAQETKMQGLKTGRTISKIYSFIRALRKNQKISRSVLSSTL